MFVSKITKTYFEELIDLLTQYDILLRSNKEIDQWFHKNHENKKIFSVVQDTIMMIRKTIDRDFIYSTILFFQFDTLDYALSDVHRNVLHVFSLRIFPKSAASDRDALQILFSSFQDQRKKIGRVVISCRNLVKGTLVNPNLIVGDGFFFKRKTNIKNI